MNADSNETASIQEIVVRSVNWIGDAVLTTPALTALKRRYPEARLTVAVRPWTAPVFEKNPDVDEILLLDGGFFKAVRQLRERRFDLAVILPNSFRSALEMFFAGIPRRVGYRRDGRGLLLTHSVAPTEERLRIHQVYYYLALAEELGAAVDAPRLRLVVGKDEQSAVKQKFGLSERPLLALNPGAAYGMAKRWFPDRFAAVADALIEEHTLDAVVIGSPKEAETGEEVLSASRTKRIKNLAGATTLREMMAVLSLSSFLVTNDSGPMHVGAALGLPLAAVFGPTDPATTCPFDSPYALVRKNDVNCAPCLKRECPRDHRCMERITVEDVLSACRTLIKETGAFS